MYQDTAQDVGFRPLNEARPAPSDGLTSACDKINALTNHIYQINESVTDHADRILGGRPGSDEKPAPSPVRSGALGALHDHIDRLEAAVQRLDEQSRRFNAV